MTDTTESMPGIGHNAAPSAIASATALAEIVATWIATHPEIEDGELAKNAGNYVEKLRESKKALTTALREEARPHDEAIDEIKTRYRIPTDAVDAGISTLLKMSSAWIQKVRAREAAEKAAREAEARRLREEADRLERERMEEKRRANEAALHADAESRAEAEAARLDSERAAAEAQKVAREAERAATKKVAPVVIKGEEAKRSIRMQVTWSAVVTDEAAAIESYRDHPEVRAATLAAALKVATAVARATKSESGAPAGFRFVRDERAI